MAHANKYEKEKWTNYKYGGFMQTNMKRERGQNTNMDGSCKQI